MSEKIDQIESIYNIANDPSKFTHFFENLDELDPSDICTKRPEKAREFFNNDYLPELFQSDEISGLTTLDIFKIILKLFSNRDGNSY